MSMAEYARRVGVSRAAISHWKKEGRLVLQGSQVDVEQTDARLKRYRRDGLPAIQENRKPVKLGRPSVRRPANPAALRDATADARPVETNCCDIERGLSDLDWQQAFDWAEDAQKERARLAAHCIGWMAVESDKRDDGHWGGFQLRCHDADADGYEGGVMAGYGFELSPQEVLRLCRREVEVSRWDDGSPMFGDDDTTGIVPELLPLLAHPFDRSDKQR